jgi:hypothetical protein
LPVNYFQLIKLSPGKNQLRFVWAERGKKMVDFKALTSVL